MIYLTFVCTATSYVLEAARSEMVNIQLSFSQKQTSYVCVTKLVSPALPKAVCGTDMENPCCLFWELKLKLAGVFFWLHIK